MAFICDDLDKALLHTLEGEYSNFVAGSQLSAFASCFGLMLQDKISK